MESVQFQDQLYEDVHEKLKFIGEGPAAFFRDICRLLDSRDYNLESETHIIAFLFREIESAIRDAVRTKADEPNSGDEDHKKDVKQVLSRLKIPEDHPVREIWLRYTDQNYDYQFNKLAHRTSFKKPKQRKKEIEDAWEDFIYVLDVIIDKIQSNFFDTIKLIDRILDKPPSKDRAKLLDNHIPKNETTLVYLFQHCNDPKWLPRFDERGFFDHPPSGVYDHENDLMQYPQWPAGIYLQKVAKDKPKEVTRIIERIPVPDNFQVHENLIRAIANMPADISARHIDLVINCIQSGSVSHTADSYMDLVFHLAENGFSDEASEIIRKLYGPVKSDDKSSRTPYSSSDLAVSNYAYEDFLINQIKELRKHLGEETINLLAQIMDDFLHDQFSSPKDASFSWARSLSLDPNQSYRSVHHVKNNILRALISEMNHFIKDGTSYTDIVAILDDYDWHLFDRIKLLLYKRHDDLEQIKPILLDDKLFDQYWISREYKSTLEKFYQDLAEEEQQQILGWIDEGLSFETAKKRHVENDPTDEEVEKLQKHWKLVKLHPIAEYLENSWKNKYESLVDTFGNPKKEEDTFDIQYHTGPTSPKDVEELSQHSPEEVIAYLKEWEPEETYGSPSPRGLSRVLREVIEEQPAAYAEHAADFKTLLPNYIYSLILGLREALKNGSEIDWQTVLSLCRYALEQEDDEQDVQDDRLGDPIWLRIHKRIADLIGVGCRATSHPIPFQYRDEVWELIYPLTQHPQPDEEFEQQKDREPMGVSINTVRGEAMHAVFKYMYWVRTHDEDEGSVSFAKMPEVQKVLERHLDTNQEPTLTIRSVYGQHLWQLIKTDPDWLNSHLDTIFPTEAEQQPLFYAAWYGFITQHRAHQLLLTHLQPVYEQAITQLNLEFDSWDNGLMPDRRLAEHLLGYYWHGDLTLDSELLDTFFKHAPAELRGYLFEYIGRNLDRMEAKLDDEICVRLENFMNYRINKGKSVKNDSSYEEELAYFGYCFPHDTFEQSQHIGRLHEVLKITPQVENSRAVMQQLPNYVDEYPEKVMDCIENMVKSTDRTLDIQVWREPLKEILSKLLEKEESSSKRAKGLIQYISQRRFHLMEEFRSLLE